MGIINPLIAVIVGAFVLLAALLATLTWVVLSLLREDDEVRQAEAEYIAVRAYLVPQRHARRRADSVS